MNKIKKKKIRWHKVPKEYDPDKAKQQLTTMKRELTKAKNAGYRIVYIDETMFTRKTCPDTEWAKAKENMAVDLAKLEEPTLALLAGISKEKGIEHFEVFEFSVNVDRFIEYLTKLREANPEDKIALFMDNLSAHTSDRSKEAMRERGFRWIYNIPYSPEYNPIEFVFSQVKHNFRALRAKKLIGMSSQSHEAIVKQAIM